MNDKFENWMDRYSYEGIHWSELDYTPDAMRAAFEAGRKSVALDELARKGQILDEIMAHYKVDPDGEV